MGSKCELGAHVCCRPVLRREAPAARWTVAPGDTGSTMYFYARVIDITLGVMIVLVFDLIFPWCAASATCFL